MSKTKTIAVIIFILSLGIFASMLKVAKVVIVKNENIGELSKKRDELIQNDKELSRKLEDREKELALAKQDIEDLEYKLEEERNRVKSFQAKYESEKKRGDELEENLSKAKISLEEEKKAKEALSAEAEKLKEEKDFLSRELNEVKIAKEALEAFVAESKEETALGTPAKIESLTTSGRIIALYPQGLVGIELEDSYEDKLNPGVIVAAKKRIKVSKVYRHMLILETAEVELLSDLKKGDAIKYMR